MIFSDKVYKILKWVAQIFLPALTTFYGVLGATLSIPYTQEVITIAIGFDAFLGAILQISTENYNNKGE